MLRDFGAFIEDHYIRSSWIALLTLWILWGLSYVLRHAFGDPTPRYIANPNATTAAAAAAPPATTEEEAEAAKARRFGFLHRFGGDSFTNNVWNSHRLLRDNLLMLLTALVINTFSNGSTRGVAILAWIFFAFTVLFALMELVVNHHFVRLGYSIIFYGLALAIVGLAFHLGW